MAILFLARKPISIRFCLYDSPPAPFLDEDLQEPGGEAFFASASRSFDSSNFLTDRQQLRDKTFFASSKRSWQTIRQAHTPLSPLPAEQTSGIKYSLPRPSVPSVQPPSHFRADSTRSKASTERSRQSSQNPSERSLLTLQSAKHSCAVYFVYDSGVYLARTLLSRTL